VRDNKCVQNILHTRILREEKIRSAYIQEITKNTDALVGAIDSSMEETEEI
jgi:hypothetical protein